MLRPSTLSLISLGILSGRGLASQILKTSGFSECLAGSNITVQNLDMAYDHGDKTITFNVAGTSLTRINVTATLNISAYGISVYENTFNPCSESTYIQQLCPIPSGTFSATGTQTIAPSYASMIPPIAFSIPDIAAKATLELKALDTGENVACITSNVGNGKTANVAAVSYVAAGIAGAALVVSGLSAVGTAVGGSNAGAGSMSPSFTEVLTYFQGVAMSGMMSVNYPPVYMSFTKNFAFSGGLIPWTAMQTSIDSFRNATGGNLTTQSVAYLQNATLVHGDGSSSNSKRAVGLLMDGLLLARDSLETDVSETASTSETASSASTVEVTVDGIKAYVEELSIPSSNTFMTVLLVVACVVAAIAVGILLFKVILETWALFGSFPPSLTGFRKHYWGTMARAIVQLILVLYGIWVLYCIFQFTHGDSWAAKTLAGVTLAIFTGVLAFFTYKIWSTANELKKTDGDSSGLYENKAFWLKYSIFYDNYKKDFWWIFVPAIIYMFAKGCVLAAGDGHGLFQTIAQLIIEICSKCPPEPERVEGISLTAAVLGLLVWNRPYERRSGNVINIFIQVVRALTVICILVFVEEMGVAQTTQTITGVVLIAVQSGLAAILAVLIAVNAIILCCKENPHRKRRKEAEKLNRDTDNLTPLDARNSLLMDLAKSTMSTTTYESDRKRSNDSFMNEPTNPHAGATPMRSYTVQSQHSSDQKLGRSLSSDDSRFFHAHEDAHLVPGAAPMGGREQSPRPAGPPTGYAGYGVGY
ncbi:transient receptor potential ion channel [Diplocarpon rosae]|nr:transient receptor potential ion channel [Diplocarpon rosae]